MALYMLSFALISNSRPAHQLTCSMNVDVLHNLDNKHAKNSETSHFP